MNERGRDINDQKSVVLGWYSEICECSCSWFFTNGCEASCLCFFKNDVADRVVFDCAIAVAHANDSKVWPQHGHGACDSITGIRNRRLRLIWNDGELM